MQVLGVNAFFHDPAAAVVADGRIVATGEDERFSRRKHGKQPVAFSTWEMPVPAARWCLEFRWWSTPASMPPAVRWSRRWGPL
ncbi:hypothetical protein H7H52_09610 [Mycolicibacter hiberniae]|nr:hypothetical protein [Mycolicibacter hiberniae]